MLCYTYVTSVHVFGSCISFKCVGLFVCFFQVFVIVLALEGCYLLHGPGWACYVTHARSVHFLDSCVNFSLFVRLFITGVCECYHPRGLLFVTRTCMAVLCYTCEECLCP